MSQDRADSLVCAGVEPDAITKPLIDFLPIPRDDPALIFFVSPPPTGTLLLFRQLITGLRWGDGEVGLQPGPTIAGREFCTLFQTRIFQGAGEGLSQSKWGKIRQGEIDAFPVVKSSISLNEQPCRERIAA